MNLIEELPAAPLQDALGACADMGKWQWAVAAWLQRAQGGVNGFVVAMGQWFVYFVLVIFCSGFGLRCAHMRPPSKELLQQMKAGWIYGS